jgi:hypothetical protein
MFFISLEMNPACLSMQTMLDEAVNTNIAKDDSLDNSFLLEFAKTKFVGCIIIDIIIKVHNN